MIVAGVICLIAGILLLISSVVVIDEDSKTILGSFSGFVFMFGLMFLLPPIKYPKNVDFEVITKEPVQIKKTVFIDDSGKADTTYHYVFKNSDVK